MRLTREIKYTPLASQQRFHGITARFKGFSGPVGSGKSLCLVHEAIKLSYINHGLLGLIGAPTYPMLRDVTHRAFMEVLERDKIPHRYFKQENRIHMLDTGSDIIFRSMDNPKSLVGTNLAWFGVDEMTFTEREAFQRLQARLRHPRAVRLCGFAVWTPNSFDWVYEDFIGPSKKYEAVLATPRENKYVVESGLYDELAKSYDAKFAAQEIEGQYLAVFSGRVYHAFDRSIHVQPVRYDKRLDLCWALDFNIDPMSSVIFQVDPGDYLRGATVNILDEISLKGGHTQDACSEFKRKLEEICAAANGIERPSKCTAIPRAARANTPDLPIGRQSGMSFVPIPTSTSSGASRLITHTSRIGLTPPTPCYSTRKARRA